MAHLNGYAINGGDLKGLTFLQKAAIRCINDILLKWKTKQKPFVTI